MWKIVLKCISVVVVVFTSLQFNKLETCNFLSLAFLKMHTLLNYLWNIYLYYHIKIYFSKCKITISFLVMKMSRRVSKSFKNPELTPMYRIVPKSLMMLKVPSAAFKVYLEDLAKKILPHFYQDIILQS